MKTSWLAKVFRRILGVLITFFILLLCISSCMRFRTSDSKTKDFFREAQVACEIMYATDSLKNRKVRAVKTTGKTITENAVLFIHGAPGSADAFYKYLKDSVLLSNAVLYSIDRPGYGYSGFGNSVTSIEEQTRLINQILAKIPESRVVVVGHSFGGPIAANISLLSDKVTGVLMIAPAIDPDNEKILAIAHFGRWKATRWMIPKAWLVSADEKFSHIKELSVLEPKWKEVHVPVTVMHGKKDQLVPFENTAFTGTHFAQTRYRLVVFEKENHFIPWTQERAVIEEILKLL